MKLVFVVGFGTQVRRMLDGAFLAQIENGTISWTSEGSTAANVAKFKEIFGSRFVARRPQDALVILANSAEQTWAEGAVERVIGQLRGQFPQSRIGLHITRDPDGVHEVENRINAFGLPNPDIISPELVQAKLGEGKVFCVVAAGRTSILEALARAGVSTEALEQQFEEEVIATGRNSTLMAHLEGSARSYAHMLYAWKDLRTSSKGLVNAFKRKNGRFYEADSAAKVADLLKRYLTS